ncbi:hypothetical protein WMF31_02485 [Sorangium sp. So ce1036]|uniref:Mu transposase domain-containing protein n=1 Tax=Sorangium sp. So ce1036 TaxID=3133328 RepID=UPI003F0DCDAF
MPRGGRCDKVNAKVKRSLHASPRELFAVERQHLAPLPVHVPEVYQLHERIVDCEGYVTVHRNRYSAPWRLIGRHLEVRETKDRIDLYDGPRRVATHERIPEPIDARVTVPEHRPPRSEKVFARDAPSAEERELSRGGDEVIAYVALLKRRGRSLRVLRRLAAMMRDYPREPLLAAVRIATHYGLDDRDRLERLVLRHVAGDFFPLPPEVAGAPLCEEGRDDEDGHDEPDGEEAPEADDTPGSEDDDDG